MTEIDYVRILRKIYFIIISYNLINLLSVYMLFVNWSVHIRAVLHAFSSQEKAWSSRST